LEHSKSNLNEDAEVNLLDSRPGNAKQMLYTAWIDEWMMKNSSAMLDWSRNLNCHGCSCASTVHDSSRILQDLASTYFNYACR
jgi:hypothetical protein